jgi:hypothetical protein
LIAHPGVEAIEVDPAGAAKGVFQGAAENDVLSVGGSATVMIPAAQALASLTISDSAVVRISGDALLTTAGLAMSDAATLDLADGSLIVDGGDAAAIVALVKSARNAGTWSGAGITSSQALGSATTGLAATLNPGLDTFADHPVDPDDILIKHTHNGDANLDGQVNFDDYFRIDSAYLEQPANPTYAQGDFNYDGTINFDDYFLIDSAFLGQSGTLGARSGLSGGESGGASLLAVSDDSTGRADLRRRQWAGRGGQREESHAHPVGRVTMDDPGESLFGRQRVRGARTARAIVA